MAERRLSLKKMLAAQGMAAPGQGDPNNIIPKLVDMGGGAFGALPLPGAPQMQAQQQGQMDMSGWADILKKLFGQTPAY